VVVTGAPKNTAILNLSAEMKIISQRRKIASRRAADRLHAATFALERVPE
jgi:hypothetical protein